MSNFWQTLPAGFVGLSPMDGVTDHPCRHIQKKHGNPDMVYTEFTCVEGITHGATRLLKDFLFDETQRPIVAQIYGHTPEDFRIVALIVCQLGFDGVDINMGCPSKNVTHLGSGAALIKTPQLAVQIVQAVKDGINDWYNGKTVDDTALSDEIKTEINKRAPAKNPTREKIPLSIKTRIGYDKVVTSDWISTLLGLKPQAIAIHGRTLTQRHSGEVNWEEVAKAGELAHQVGCLVIGNGDIKSVAEAKEKSTKYNLDGMLIGRASWGNPWVFLSKANPNLSASQSDLGKPASGSQQYIPTLEERFTVTIEHAELYEKTFQHTDKYNFLPMRKHLAWYLSGFPGAVDIRMQAMKTNSSEEVKMILKNLVAV